MGPCGATAALRLLGRLPTLPHFCTPHTSPICRLYSQGPCQPDTPSAHAIHPSFHTSIPPTHLQLADHIIGGPACNLHRAPRAFTHGPAAAIIPLDDPEADATTTTTTTRDGRPCADGAGDMAWLRQAVSRGGVRCYGCNGSRHGDTGGGDRSAGGDRARGCWCGGRGPARVHTLDRPR